MSTSAWGVDHGSEEVSKKQRKVTDGVGTAAFLGGVIGHGVGQAVGARAAKTTVSRYRGESLGHASILASDFGPGGVVRMARDLHPATKAIRRGGRIGAVTGVTAAGADAVHHNRKVMRADAQRAALRRQRAAERKGVAKAFGPVSFKPLLGAKPNEQVKTALTTAQAPKPMTAPTAPVKPTMAKPKAGVHKSAWGIEH